ncbi:MAG: hypothetical protein V3S29_07090 [bacterium]
MWRSALLLAVALVWSVRSLADPGLPAEPVFVRGGIVLRAPALQPASLRIDGSPVGKVRRLPGGGWLVEFAWLPRGKLRMEWREQGGGRSLGLTAPLRPTPWLRRRISWQGGGFLSRGPPGTITALAFSDNGLLLAVGDDRGRAAVFDVDSGQTVWQARRPGRVVKHLAFSATGKMLFVGEQGPEGRLAAYDLEKKGGPARWVLDTAAELGAAGVGEASGPYGWVRQPGAYRIVAAGDDVIAAFSRSWPAPGGAAALARVFRLDGLTGRRRWAFPAEGPAARIITWLGVDAGAGGLALPLQLPAGANPAAGASAASGARAGAPAAGRTQVVVLQRGRVVFRHSIAAVPPQKVATLWRGVALHPAGDRLAVSTQDGRGFLFARSNNSWALAREIRLVAPVRIGKTLVAATNGTLAATAREVLFVTGPSFAPQAWAAGGGGGSLGRGHPRANTVFSHDWQGRPRWIWRLENDLQGMALDGSGNVLALALGRETLQRAGDFNGVVLLDLSVPGDGRAKLSYRFPLAGRVTYGGVAVSRDGKSVALAEAPRRIWGDARPAGSAGVVLLR